MKMLPPLWTAIAGALCVALLTVAPANAQPRTRLKDDPNQGKAALADYTSDPVVTEARDRSIRGRIPVLRDAVIDETRHVDPDELYERQLAMHGDSEAFERALDRHLPWDTGGDEKRPRARPPGTAPAMADDAAGWKIALVIGFVAIALLGYLAAVTINRASTRR